MSADLPDPDIATRFGSGRAVPRIEDEGLLKGAGRYTDDLQPAGAAARGVRALALSACAHRVGRRRQRRAACRAWRWWSPAPTSCRRASSRCRGNAAFKRAGGAPVRVARRGARWRTSACASSASRWPSWWPQTLQQARDAAEAVWVEYEELPHVIDVRTATAARRGRAVRRARPTTSRPRRATAMRPRPRRPSPGRGACGRAWTSSNQRVAALALEPRTVLAWTADDGRLTIRMSTQMPSGVRTTVCDVLGLPREQVRVTVGDVGGGFGMKTGVYPEDVAVA